MVYPIYIVRLLARSIILKADGGQGTPADLVLAYPEVERTAILAQVYWMRPDFHTAQ